MEQLTGAGLRKEYDRATHLFNLHTEHIIRKARLHELHAGIKTGRRSINNVRYVDDTTLTAESKEPLDEDEGRERKMVTAAMEAEDDCFSAGKL